LAWASTLSKLRYNFVWFTGKKDANTVSELLKKCRIAGDSQGLFGNLDDVVNLCLCTYNETNPKIAKFLYSMGYSSGVGICMFIDGSVVDSFRGDVNGNPYDPNNILSFIQTSIPTPLSTNGGGYGGGWSNSPPPSSSQQSFYSQPSAQPSAPSPPKQSYAPSTASRGRANGNSLSVNSQREFSYLFENPESVYLSHIGNLLNPENNGIEMTPANRPWTSGE
jgi:hypothetical protein